MKLAFSFLARVLDQDSEREVEISDSADGLEVTSDRLESYFDPEIADPGVIGGEIRLAVQGAIVRLEVIYWMPTVPVEGLLELIREYTVAQMEDGIGEGGFAIELEGHALIVQVLTDRPVNCQLIDDGKFVPGPHRIAISARNGDIGALTEAIAIDGSEIERMHQGHSPLQLAILYGHDEVVPLLIAADADVMRIDSQGSTLLHLCAVSNSCDDEKSLRIAKLLLDSGTSPHHVASNGETAKSYAELRGKIRMAGIL